MKNTYKNILAESSKRALQFGLGIAIVVSGSVYAATYKGIPIPAQVKAGDTVQAVEWNNINNGMKKIADKVTGINYSTSGKNNEEKRLTVDGNLNVHSGKEFSRIGLGRPYTDIFADNSEKKNFGGGFFFRTSNLAKNKDGKIIYYDHLRIAGHGEVGIGGINPRPGLNLDLKGKFNMKQSNDQDVWIQGGGLAGGEKRNLALMGDSKTDELRINVGGDYTHGTRIDGTLRLFNRKGIAKVEKTEAEAKQSPACVGTDGDILKNTVPYVRCHIEENGKFYIKFPRYDYGTKLSNGNIDTRGLINVAHPSRGQVIIHRDGKIEIKSKVLEPYIDFANIKAGDKDFDLRLQAGANDVLNIKSHPSTQKKGGLRVEKLAGKGDAFACVDASGELFRKATPCK